MKSSVEQVRDNLVKLTIEVSPEEFADALDKAFEKVVKEVKVDGFRPGKCPKSMFLKRFGYEALYEEAVNFALNETYPKAVEENKIVVVNQPQIDLDFKTLNKDEGFTYTASVDVLPEFTLGEYKGLNVKKAPSKASAKEVKAEIDRALQNKAENVVKETPALNGDTVVIDFEGFVDGVAFEGGKGENYPLELGSNSFIPGFEDQLIGTKSDDEVDVKVTFPKEYHAELAGKDATFKVKVHEVKTKVVPELTDDFVKDLEIEGVNTVDEYKKHVQNDLDAHAKEQSEEKFVNDLIDKASDNTKVNLPECMIKDYAEDMKENAKKQAAQYNIPFEMYLQYMGHTPESFEKQVWEIASKRIKADLVISKIAEAEKIAITKEEVEAEYVKLAGDNNTKVEELKKRIDPSQLVYKMEQTKVIEVLKNNVKVEVKKAAAPKETAPKKKATKEEK